MRLEIEVPNQTFTDTLTTAIESGIAYWGNDYGYRFNVERDADLNVVKVIILREGADAETPKHRTFMTQDKLPTWKDVLRMARYG